MSAYVSPAPRPPAAVERTVICEMIFLEQEAVMASVGLVGGLGPESTVDYYRRILGEWQQGEPNSAPLMVIDSLDVQRAIRLVGTDRDGLIEYLSGSIDRLTRAGVDFIAMTANTPHLVFDELSARSKIPMLSIVEVCVDEAQRLQVRRPLLLGTRFTMEAPFYPDVFRRRGITVVTPDADDRTWVHDRYIGELLKGEFRDETRDGIVSRIRRLRATAAADAVILGGTELPLLLRSETIEGLPTLDTTALHVAAIVKRLRESP